MSKTVYEVREAAQAEADRFHAAFHPDPFASEQMQTEEEK